MGAMTNTVEAAKARIIDTLPASVREEYVALGKEAERLDRQVEALKAEASAVRKHRESLAKQTVTEETPDRNLAILRHTSSRAYSLFIDRVRAIHPRMFGIINYNLGGLGSGEAPYLGAQMRVSTYYEETLGVEGAPALAAALRTFAERFVYEVPDYGPEANMVAVAFTGYESRRTRTLELFFEPDGTRSIAYIGHEGDDRAPVTGTLEETMEAVITQVLEWNEEDAEDD